MELNMLCRQCEQTAGGTGCTKAGVCGKDPRVAQLQDNLVYHLIGIAYYMQQIKSLGYQNKEIDLFIKEGLFTTVTNVNFDSDRIQEIIAKAQYFMEKIKADVLKKYPGIVLVRPVLFDDKKEKSGIMPDSTTSEDIRSLREIILYGLKGMAAYADHALILGKEDEQVDAFFYKGLAALGDDTVSVDALVGLIMELGKVNLRCMEILDEGNTQYFGNPVPTEVILGVKKGPAIIVSGHDLFDLKQLLEQTEGTDVSIYTHGEMLPAHGYPELKKYKHLAGHFGTAWQNQQKEFSGIPAVILMTTNCIQKPADSYKDRIFTTGLVAWPGLIHIFENKGKKDFTALIEKAKQLKGFTEETPDAKKILVGFAHNAVLAVADKVIEAVKTGKIKHFFLIGGCDGAKPGRNYYTEFAQKVPHDCVILTLACGKFRFNQLDFGTIGGIPRLLDCGQCNDAYSAIKIASALAQAFHCGVNDLPLSLILSWYEQKAVCILLTLFSLGIKNIRLGPTLPAFVSSNVLNVLVDKFNIQPITTPERDLKAILG